MMLYYQKENSILTLTFPPINGLSKEKNLFANKYLTLILIIIRGKQKEPPRLKRTDRFWVVLKVTNPVLGSNFMESVNFNPIPSFRMEPPT